MRVENSVGNYVYDDTHHLCAMELCRSQGKNYAFVTAIDVGMPETPLPEPKIKRYWGLYDPDKPEVSVQLILDWGGKWPLGILAGEEE